MARRRRRRSVARATQQRALEALHGRLAEEYGTPEPVRRLPGLDEVGITILSQNTSDTNRDRAWTRLKERFPDWESVVAADRAEIEEALEPGGLHRVKAQRIVETLQRVHELRGAYDLEHLREMDVESARAELSRFKGLGSKSVNCILLFSLGMEAFPVDTHVYRVLRRLDVHRCRELGRANDELQDAVPEGLAFPLHMNVIRHGREVCRARRPRCRRCRIEDLCAYPDKETP